MAPRRLAWALAAVGLAGCIRPAPRVPPVPVVHYVPPKPVVFTTQSALDQASCRAADGSWHCSMPEPPRRLAAARTPSIPASWQVGAWAVDGLNLSGCASELNNCTQTACGAVGSGLGPCLTYGQEIVARLGTTTPRWQQATTTVTWLSAQATDRVYMTPQVEGGSLVQFAGVPALVATYTGGLSIVSKVRGGPGQLLNATFDASAAVGMLAVNTTHPSHATLYKALGANVFAVSQPMTFPAFPSTTQTAEVDTWASTDTVSLYTLPQVNFVRLQPTIETGGTNSKVYLSQLTVYDPAGSGSLFWLNQNVRAFDVTFQRNVIHEGGDDGFANSGCNNCVFGRAFERIGMAVSRYTISGGYIASNAGTGISGGFVGLDADFIVNSNVTATSLGAMVFGAVYFDTNALVSILGTASANPIASGGPFLWGSGNHFEIDGSAHFGYPAGAGKAVATFLLTGALELSAQTKACLLVPSAASSFGTCNKALSPANLDADLGTTSGCYVASNAAICNTL